MSASLLERACVSVVGVCVLLHLFFACVRVCVIASASVFENVVCVCVLVV